MSAAKFGQLRDTALTIARLMSERRYHDLHELASAAAQARVSRQRLAEVLTELHTIAETDSVSAPSEAELLEENAGATGPADFETRSEARVPFRLHSRFDLGGGTFIPSDSIQVWTLVHEDGGWRVPFEDLR